MTAQAPPSADSSKSPPPVPVETVTSVSGAADAPTTSAPPDQSTAKSADASPSVRHRVTPVVVGGGPGSLPVRAMDFCLAESGISPCIVAGASPDASRDAKVGGGGSSPASFAAAAASLVFFACSDFCCFWREAADFWTALFSFFLASSCSLPPCLAAAAWAFCAFSWVRVSFNSFAAAAFSDFANFEAAAFSAFSAFAAAAFSACWAFLASAASRFATASGSSSPASRARCFSAAASDFRRFFDLCLGGLLLPLFVSECLFLELSFV